MINDKSLLQKITVQSITIQIYINIDTFLPKKKLEAAFCTERCYSSGTIELKGEKDGRVGVGVESVNVSVYQRGVLPCLLLHLFENTKTRCNY